MSEPKSASSTASSDSAPSFVNHLDFTALASLATKARGQSISCTVDQAYKIGAFNIVWFIDFADGVQWVARVPIASWSPMLERAMRSDMTALKLITTRTSLPVPAIYDFSPVQDNPLGRPYTLMSRVKGTQLAKLWFDPEWFTPEHRRNVFHSIAENMAQLKILEFPAIGSLEEAPGDLPRVGPLLPSLDEITENEEPSMLVPRGPYTTVHSYIMSEISTQIASAPSPDHKVSLALVRMFASALLDETLDEPPFVLSVPDFDYQNIFVDDDGNVTGIIDWDGVIVGPRQGGYARYPSWITRDWDPLMYGYPMDEPSPQEESDEEEEDGSEKPGSEGRQVPPREELQEDSPEVLQQFRDEYLAAYKAVDPEGARMTRHSHICEAIQIAVSMPFCRGHIIERLSRYVFGADANTGGPLSSWALEQGVGQGDWLNQMTP
ncbi:hypothetical protein BV22DRAFT_1191246 [Leucogyrophana mollusca]|uniref:Uncharacterized protein n=1 Tax=Leucogyrophana mollusca TaxID=85980 RepID=A0ACB8BXV3_9AGAM|nr:hypothetical protein BV22DRAFT_1191246 [Leucogyrophana mollusca]